MTATIHTALTTEDIDTINRCRRDRLLNAAVLLELGLHHLNDEVPIGDPESIRLALLDVVGQLREDASRIGVTIRLAGDVVRRPDAFTDGER